jgi:hypothetical protein
VIYDRAKADTVNATLVSAVRKSVISELLRRPEPPAGQR